MRLSRWAALCGITVCACALLTVDGAAQARGGARSSTPGGQGGRVGPPAPPVPPAPRIADDPFSGEVVTNAPFSADAVTTVTQVLSDGTRIEQSTTARFYRDRAGRLRREQTILGLDALNPAGGSRTVITVVPDPGDQSAFTLDPATRTARRGARSSGPVVFASPGSSALGLHVATLNNGVLEASDVQARRVTRVGAGAPEPGGVAQPEEALGTRQIEGVTATGRRMKSVIPAGQIGNDRPIEITDERWESQELRLLVRSHHHDPRTGDVEYRLTNILRVEPPADLFVVPPDYTIQADGRGVAPGLRTGGPGLRTGGPAAK
jgi:hypothetical protein